LSSHTLGYGTFLLSSLLLAIGHGFAWTALNRPPSERSISHSGEPAFGTYTIFEGTWEIQRLIIARAISGVHVQ
jgi:hypothetical protein